MTLEDILNMTKGHLCFQYDIAIHPDTLRDVLDTMNAELEKEAEERANSFLEDWLPHATSFNQRLFTGRAAADIYRSGLPKHTNSSAVTSLFGFRVIQDAYVAPDTIELRPREVTWS